MGRLLLRRLREYEARRYVQLQRPYRNRFEYGEQFLGSFQPLRQVGKHSVGVEFAELGSRRRTPALCGLRLGRSSAASLAKRWRFVPRVAMPVLQFFNEIIVRGNRFLGTFGFAVPSNF